ncbi:hypothetical protein HME9302_02568 [Alteripontixanthobacter maritimus]|uniref:Uncharacterized protein n=1 Tax=Alteripontixanthobacter maritimus TaxID=2161824 RepID=A0A369QDQ0_9SPHN|nr:hypothetical protein HME9302_02568 [Alteripontixanthobacter maritimus]
MLCLFGCADPNVPIGFARSGLDCICHHLGFRLLGKEAFYPIFFVSRTLCLISRRQKSRAANDLNVPRRALITKAFQI